MAVQRYDSVTLSAVPLLMLPPQPTRWKNHVVAVVCAIKALSAARLYPESLTANQIRDMLSLLNRVGSGQCAGTPEVQKPIAQRKAREFLQQFWRAGVPCLNTGNFSRFFDVQFDDCFQPESVFRIPGRSKRNWASCHYRIAQIWGVEGHPVTFEAPD